MASMLPSVLMTLLVGAFSDPNFLECGTDASTRLRVGQHIMQHAVEDAPADSPIKVEVQGSTVTVSSQAGIKFAARAFGEGATLGLNKDDTSLRATKDCKSQVYTVNGKSTTYTFTVLGKATSIVVGFHKPGFIPFAPGKVYLVTYKFPAEAPASSNAISVIEKLVCEVAEKKWIEEKATDKICSVITATFPVPDCQTNLEKIWDKVTSMCPQGRETMVARSADPKSGPIPEQLSRAWAKNAKIAVKSGDASTDLALYPKSGPIPEQLSRAWAKNAKIAVKSGDASSDLALYADPKLAAASFAPSFGAPVHFSAKDCGSGHYHSFNLSPAKIKTGEIFKVVNHFSFDEDITGGSFDVKVHALGALQLKHQTGPLCGSDTSYDVYLGPVKVAAVTVYGSQCPIAKGPASMSYDVRLASILPPYLGDASFHFTAKDQNGRDIFCVQANLGIRLRDSAQTDSTARAMVV